jgi:hypothetical protein
MSFNLGVQQYPGGYLGGNGFGTVGIYLYEDIYYRQWITEVALAFYEGRQDEFIWLDLKKQFRNPEKQQMLPLNFTKEIIDEISILYREAPIYKVKSQKTGKVLKRDQKIWEDIMKQSRYLATMDRLDHWCHLLGTVLVKVGFIDENTGQMVKETDGGNVQLTLLHGGVYDTNYHDSPYYISELLIGFGQGFTGFNRGSGPVGGGASGNNHMTGIGKNAVGGSAAGSHGQVSTIYWSPESHKVGSVDADGNGTEETIDNPYGLVPAVPFFNSDPAHYYFLPVNEPLLYANHALNMRMTDLNHIAKFQSFGVPVLSGVERGTSIRRGRPQDDHNFLRGGSVARGNGGGGGIASGAGSGFRTFDNAFGFFNDGNADANAVGMSIGPDTAISVGEKGDFKFAHPNSDITGLAKTIQQIQDWVRINHGLQPKGSSEANTGDASGFSKMLSKIGVLEENIKRQKLFMEREQQLFQVIKKLWNVHHPKGAKQLDEDAFLEITYVEPQFPVDPLTKINLIEGQRKIIESGDRRAINEMFKHMDEDQINELIKEYHEDRKEQQTRELELMKTQAKALEAAGLDYSATGEGFSAASKKAEGADKAVSKQDNRAKQSSDSSKQKGKNLDSRKQPKEERKEKPQGKKAKPQGK